MRLAIFGAGYVGLVTGVCLAKLGHDVTCVDVASDRVVAINAGRTPIFEAGLGELLCEVLAASRFRATVDANEALNHAGLSMVAVGTPSSDGRIDLSYVEQATATIGRHLRRNAHRHTVVVKSTVVPGTTARVVRRVLERESGRTAGEGFGLSMNPEFLREGRAVEDFMNPDRVVIGEYDARSGDDVAALYGSLDCPKLRTSIANAELIKYASNALLANLVSFSNELYALSEATEDADGETIMDGLALDRRLSPVVDGRRLRPEILTYLRGGIGFGGSCLPKDIAALRGYAHQREVQVPLLEAVTRVNKERSERVVALLERAVGKPLRDRVVTVLGIAFKPDTDDLRDSPAIPLVEALLSRGARVRVHEPRARISPELFSGPVEVAEHPRSAFEGADGVLLATAWSEYKEWDYESLVPLMRTRIVIDGRNSLRHVAWPASTVYVPVGRGP